MLTTVAALIILMGLAVSLAREVRRRSADDVTRELLHELDAVLARYVANNNALPQIPALFPTPVGARPGSTTQAESENPVVIDQETVARAARANNEKFVEALRTGGGFTDDIFGKVPRSMFDDQTLRDAWGSPIVFMPAMHPMIGMAADNRPFFFSAGPDRKFMTREDNLYSYEGR